MTQSNSSYTRLAALLLALAPLAGACVGEVETEELDGVDSQELVAECEAGESQSCDVPGAPELAGIQFCDDDGILPSWSECQPDAVPPPPPETCPEGTVPGGSCCVTAWGCCVGDVECNTPLVLAFDDERVRYTSDVNGSFDLTGHGMSVANDWPTAATPWLALDRDSDGSIGDGGELFGSATQLAGGGFALNGFVALAQLDENGDGVISSDDARFSELVLWTDADASRTSDASELSSLQSHRVVDIELAYASVPHCDARGNCEVERARFRYQDADGKLHEGSVIDVHLRVQH